jgi:transcriptional regulator with XRE-family HTH domain
MSVEQSGETQAGLAQEIDRFHVAIRHSPAANSHQELQPALEVVEATVVHGLARALETTARFSTKESDEAQETIDSRQADLTKALRLSSLALDVVLQRGPAIDRALDLSQGDPELFSWLREQLHLSRLSQESLAARANIHPSTLSRLLRNLPSDKISSARIMTVAQHALRRQANITRERYDIEMAVARSLYADYEEWWLQRQIERSNPPRKHTLAEPARSLETLEPVIGMIGATNLEGLGILRGATVKIVDPYRQKMARRIVEGHYATLDTLLELSRLSIGALQDEAGSKEWLIDRMYGLPTFLRLLQKTGKKLEFTQTEIATELRISESRVSRVLHGRTRSLPPDIAEQWVGILAEEGFANIQKRESFIEMAMSAYEEYAALQPRPLGSTGADADDWSDYL